MGEPSRTINLEELLNYSDNLIGFLNDEKDIIDLKNFLRQAEILQSQCDKDFNETQKSIEDYEKKIEACKHKAAAAQSESAADAELELLQKELEEEQNLERMLREELRGVVNEIDELESKRESVDKQRQTIKKFEQDELRAQTKLSMYASVTKIVPNFDDPSRISGCIVDKDKKALKKFEFDPSKFTSFDTCNSIWKLINSS